MTDGYIIAINVPFVKPNIRLFTKGRLKGRIRGEVNLEASHFEVDKQSHISPFLSSKNRRKK